MKKYVSVLIAAALCAGLLAAPGAAQTAYPAWAAQAVSRWIDCGKLDQDIHPSTPVTSKMAAALFACVTDRGPEGGTGAILTRQEAAVLVAETFGITGGGRPDYLDAGLIAPDAAPVVGALQQASVMQGSGGYFRPNDPITYLEMVLLVDNALHATNPITGLSALARDAGVLKQGTPAHVNDGRFVVDAVSRTGDGYLVQLHGTAPLVGQQAGEVASGQPQWDGKWMGICLSLDGLVQADQMQYSTDGEHWTQCVGGDALNPEYVGDSVLVYVNGAQDAAADSPEADKTSTLYLRQGEDGASFAVVFHYTPAR